MSTLLTAAPLPLTLTPQTVGYAALALLLLGPVALYLYLYPYTAATLPFRNLRGPAPTSGLFGSLLTITARPIGRRYMSLTEEYGASTVRFRGLIGRWRVMSTDVTAIAHVLRHTGQWHRNEGFNGLIERTTGVNVLSVEDDAHRRQRRILNSAFNGTSVGAMMPMFWEEAYDLKKNVSEVSPPAASAHRSRSDSRCSRMAPTPRSTCSRCTSARRWTLSGARASTTTLRSTRMPTGTIPSPAHSTP